jgi:hypothetical protein
LVLQVMPQDVPSHVALPFDGTGQAVHDVVPQLLVEVLLTHEPEHLCWPDEQAHTPATHDPLLQLVPQAPQLLGSVCSSTQAPPQAL